MALAPLDEYYAGRKCLGQFRNAETGVAFEYSMAIIRPFGPEYCCAVWMSDGSFRYAKSCGRLLTL